MTSQGHFWKFYDIISPIVTATCNASITHSKFPSVYKSAIVRPALKKHSLKLTSWHCELELISANLWFVSIYTRSLSELLTHGSLNTPTNSESFQLTYRKQYSNETALVKVHNDLITAIDQGKVALLDLVRIWHRRSPVTFHCSSEAFCCHEFCAHLVPVPVPLGWSHTGSSLYILMCQTRSASTAESRNFPQ